MTINQPYNKEVINYILNNKRINDAITTICKKYIGAEYIDDFTQYIYMVYMDISQTKLLELYTLPDKTKLGKYCVTIALNHSSKNSQFHKVFLNYGRAGSTPTYHTNDFDKLEANTPLDIEQELKDNHKINTIYNILNTLKKKDCNGYYDATLFEQHIIEGKTYRQLAKETGINFTTIRLAVERTRKYIQTEIKKYNL